MSEALARRIADLLADGSALTAPEIARELRLRDIIVRDTLRSDPRFEREPDAAGRSRQARPWTLAGELVPPRGTSSTGTDGLELSDAQGQAFAPGEGFWRLNLVDGVPRSVGEAIGAAERGRAG